jgi:endonuclease/exonuclease/phosphatase family metal-dependent hydrolase
MTLSHRIMSWNINGDYDREGAQSWDKRAPVALSILNRYKPDIIGFQECAEVNLATFREQLSDYHVLKGNCYGDNPPQEHSSILFLESRYELLDLGEFWFSETPDMESADWGVEYPMGATWVKLKCIKTKQQLFHLNTHYEDGSWGEQSRVNASKLIITRISQLAANESVVITGDFNCNPWSKPYQLFHGDGFLDTYREAGNADTAYSSTFHDYKGEDYFALEYGDEMFWRVDWILTRYKVQTIASTIVQDALIPIYPSDHYPMVSEIKIV